MYTFSNDCSQCKSERTRVCPGDSEVHYKNLACTDCNSDCMLSVTDYWLITYMNTIKVHVCRCANKCCVHGCRQDTDASIMEGEYEWVREYLYDVRQDEEKRTYALRETVWGTPDYMGYVDLNTRLMVHKRGKRMKSEQLQPQEFPRPAKVWTQPLLLPETCCLCSQRVGYCASCVEIYTCVHQCSFCFFLHHCKGGDQDVHAVHSFYHIFWLPV